jgi:predicted amidohydrolase
VPYARKLWWNLALTRAMENGLPVVVSDWAAGRHEAVSTVEQQKVRAVHYTSGAACIVDPGKRPDIDATQSTITAGHKGILEATIDLEAVAAYRRHRQQVGLLPPEP